MKTDKFKRVPISERGLKEGDVIECDERRKNITIYNPKEKILLTWKNSEGEKDSERYHIRTWRDELDCNFGEIARLIAQTHRLTVNEYRKPKFFLGGRESYIFKKAKR